MNTVERLIYVPTLRCNCACVHCGQEQQLLDTEVTCAFFTQKIAESDVRIGMLSITGGEPFLKNDLPEAVAELTNRFGIPIDITTNGICTDQIQRLIALVQKPELLSFSISIDGLPEQHNRIRRNPNAFEAAVKSLQLLKNNNIAVKINTVVQHENFGTLAEFESYMHRLCHDITISWIPLISEINGEPDFPYSDVETDKLAPLFQAETDQLYLRSRGRVKIQNCHAGRKTAVIAPNGEVYTCLTGFSYKGLDRRKDFLVGDLKTQNFNEITLVMMNPKAPFQGTVQSCEGCWNPCEVGNEIHFWESAIELFELDSRKRRGGGLMEETKMIPGSTDLTDTQVNVNVEEIMREIRAQIVAESAKEQVPSFDEIPIRIESAPVATDGEDWTQFMDSLRYINERYDIPYYWELGGGGLKLFCKRIVRKLCKFLIPPILAKQNEFNACVVRCINNIRYYIEGNRARDQRLDDTLEELRRQVVDQAGQVKRYQEQLRTMESRLFELETERNEQGQSLSDLSGQMVEQQQVLETQEQQIAEQRQALQTQEQQIAEHRQVLETQERQLAEYRELLEIHGGHFGVLEGRLRDTIQHTDEAVANLTRRVSTLDQQSDAFSSSVAKAFLKYKGVAPLSPEPSDTEVAVAEIDSPNVKGSTAYDKLDYFKFQNKFRGTRSLITERQEMYLPYFTGQAGPVLDIGCGRGEFLRLMQNHGIPAFGVDLYPEYVVEGELSGLDVRQGDGVAYLAQSNELFGGIFVGQVIEHISFDQLISLCFHAYERLMPGAFLVMETPNPMSLSTFTSSFYIDPTHTKPVHPLTLEYVLREAGFTDVQTIYTDCSRPEQLPLIESDSIHNLNEVNDAIQKVSNMLYGSQDYAVIARKK